MSPLGIIIFLGFMALIVGSIIKLFKESKFSMYETKYYQRKFERDLTDKVRWIAIESDMGFIGNDSTHREVREKKLYKYIETEQGRLLYENEKNREVVEKEFCIDFSNEKEKELVCKILEIHKQSVIESFFRDSLRKDKDFYRLDFLEYYMFRLWMFLEGILNDGNRCEKLGSIELCKFSHRKGNYTTYELTNDGLLYTKLLYIVTIFCVNNEKIEPFFTNSEHTLRCIKNYLESKEISYWRHRA